MLRKILKTVMVLTLALCVVFGCAVMAVPGKGFSFGMRAEAASIVNSGKCGNKVTWELDSDGILTIQGAGEMNDFAADKSPWYEYRDAIKKAVIKDGVTNIGDYSFRYCAAMKEVTIPDSVTRIGKGAFSYSGVISVTLPDSVTFIDNNTFIYSVEMKTIKLSNSLANISDKTFYSCASLTEITIPDSVASIGGSAFYNCKGLKSIKLSGNLASIGSSAFSYCTSLPEITIPLSVLSIGSKVFDNCDSLLTIHYKGDESDWNGIQISGWNQQLLNKERIYEPDEILSEGQCGANASYKLYHDGLLRISGTGEMYNYNSDSAPWNNAALLRRIKTISVDDGITSIGSFAFYDCFSVSSIELPSSVNAIGNSAFSGCSLLTDIELPANITRLEGHMFENCTSLESITVPQKVTRIEKSAFMNCSGLQSVVIPKTVTAIGDDAFYKCNSLTDVYYRGDDAQWGGIAIGDDNDPLISAVVHYSGILEDSATGITVSVFDSEGMSLMVTRISETSQNENDRKALAASAGIGGDFVLYDISLVKGGKAVQPEFPSDVSIPVPYGFDGRKCTVYRISSDGKHEDMKASLSDGCLLFTTDRLNYFCVSNALSGQFITGDINNDNQVDTKDLTRFMRYLSGEDVEVNEAVLDVTGDKKVDSRDLVKLMKILSGEAAG